eukprot:356483_1
MTGITVIYDYNLDQNCHHGGLMQYDNYDGVEMKCLNSIPLLSAEDNIIESTMVDVQLFSNITSESFELFKEQIAIRFGYNQNNLHNQSFVINFNFYITEG